MKYAFPLFFLFLLLSNELLIAQHTFSIVAVDIETGEVGSAGATCLDNGASIISGLVPGKGAMNSQSLVCTPENLNLIKGLGLIDEGYSPTEILENLFMDDVCGAEDNQYRQYGIVTFDENGAPQADAFTGNKADSYANHIIGPNYAIQGNILIGQEVLDGIEAGFLSSDGSLAEKLMTAMQGANIVGADSRCAPNGTSSSGAFLRIACPSENENCNNLNLDVFFLPSNVEPIDELQKAFDNYFSNLPTMPINDECPNATNIDLSTDLSSCQSLNIDLKGATESLFPNPGCDKDKVFSDVWLSFNTEENLPKYGYKIKSNFDASINTSDVSDIGIAVYESCKADAFAVACLSTENQQDFLLLNSNCLQENKQYFVKIWSSDLHLYNNATFDLCIYPLQKPESYTVLWGNIPGQGDFNDGLNNWETNALLLEDEVWTWAENGIFSSLVGSFVNSSTACNGAAVFHAENYLTNGFLDGFPTGAPPYQRHTSDLISPNIDLSNGAEPVVSFYQHFAGLNGNGQTTNRGALFEYSIDGGATWFPPIAVNDDLQANEFSSTSDQKEIAIPEAAGESDVKLKFTFDGDFYFWSIDDVIISGQQISLPNDTVIIVDTIEISVIDTIFITDTTQVVINDTVIVQDTIIVNDTIFIYSTINVPVFNPMEIKLLSNPVDNILSMQILNHSNDKKALLSIFDTNGKMILTEDINLHSESIIKKDLSGLSTGVYFIKITNKQHAQTLRLLKN